MSKQAEAWRDFYRQNRGWLSTEVCTRQTPASGPGSGLDNTEPMRKALPGLFKRYGIKSILDVPCGDWNWMQEVDLTGIDYTGWDIVPQVIKANQLAFPDYRFEVHDVFTDRIPKVDLVLSRDFLLHISNRDILAVIENIRISGSRWWLASNYPRGCPNVDITKLIGCRAVDLCREPYNLEEPVEFIQEPWTKNQPKKTLALFDVQKM